MTPYEALGLYRLLNAVPERELRTFVDEVLDGVLARPDDERDDQLRTLDVLHVVVLFTLVPALALGLLTSGFGVRVPAGVLRDSDL